MNFGHADLCFACSQQYLKSTISMTHNGKYRHCAKWSIDQERGSL